MNKREEKLMKVSDFWFGFLLGTNAVIWIEIAVLVIAYLRKKKK